MNTPIAEPNAIRCGVSRKARIRRHASHTCARQRLHHPRRRGSAVPAIERGCGAGAPSAISGTQVDPNPCQRLLVIADPQPEPVAWCRLGRHANGGCQAPWNRTARQQFLSHGPPTVFASDPRPARCWHLTVRIEECHHINRSIGFNRPRNEDPDGLSSCLDDATPGWCPCADHRPIVEDRSWIGHQGRHLAWRSNIHWLWRKTSERRHEGNESRRQQDAVGHGLPDWYGVEGPDVHAIWMR